MVGILHDDFFLDNLLGLAFDFNVFFCEWFFSVTNDLILKMIKSKRVTHDELSFCLIGPFGFESDGEVADAVTFNRE